MKKINKIKIAIVSSGGGHLAQMYRLKKWWGKYDRFWFLPSNTAMLQKRTGEKIYSGYSPETRNVVNAIRNFFISLKILRHEKPDMIISFGAGIAPPFFLAAKILNIKSVFIEPIDFISFPTLSGRLVYIISDIFIVQHIDQLKFYKQAKYFGSVYDIDS